MTLDRPWGANMIKEWLLATVEGLVVAGFDDCLDAWSACRDYEDALTVLSIVEYFQIFPATIQEWA